MAVEKVMSLQRCKRYKRYIGDVLYALNQKSIRILAYHSISEDSNSYAVSADMFSRQMEWLYENNYEVISLSAAVNRLKSSKLTRKSLVITFDDGYMDNFINAYPVLKKYNFTACFFVVTGAVGKTNAWDEWALKLMGWDELMHLSKDGHIVGSHTHSHINLNGITDGDLLRVELEESGRLLREKLEAEFIPFAYPYGSGVYNDFVRSRVVRAFDCAARTGGFWGNNPATDLWGLKRRRIDKRIDIRSFTNIVGGFR